MKVSKKTSVLVLIFSCLFGVLLYNMEHSPIEREEKIDHSELPEQKCYLCGKKGIFGHLDFDKEGGRLKKWYCSKHQFEYWEKNDAANIKRTSKEIQPVGF